MIPVPPITPVPLTRPWFRGVANVRGNLYSVVDFAAFVGVGAVEVDRARAPGAARRAPAQRGGAARRPLARPAQSGPAARAADGRAGGVGQRPVRRRRRHGMERAGRTAAGAARAVPESGTHGMRGGNPMVATFFRKLSFVLVGSLLPALAAAQGAPGVTSDKILLGQAAVFSGPAAQLGIQMRNGIKAYFDFVNAKGGVHGRKLELITEDDRYEASVAPLASKKLIEEHRVFALLGYVGTPTGVAAPAGGHPGQGSAGRHVHRRGSAARAAQPLRVPRARQLLRRDREDRRAGGIDRRPQDLGVLPERRLRRGRPQGHRARARAAQDEDPFAGHGRAQHGRGRGGGQGASTPRSPTRW